MVAGFDLGADDYIIKLFELRTPLVRIGAIMRRVSHRSNLRVSSKEITLDPSTYVATFRGIESTLSGREFAVLYALMERPGTILSRSRIENRICGWSDEVAEQRGRRGDPRSAQEVRQGYHPQHSGRWLDGHKSRVMISLRRTITVRGTAMLAIVGLAAAASTFALVSYAMNKFLDAQLHEIAVNVRAIEGRPARCWTAKTKISLSSEYGIDPARSFTAPDRRSRSHGRPVGLSDVTAAHQDWRVYRWSHARQDVQVAQTWSARREIALHAATGAALPFCSPFRSSGWASASFE